MKIYRMTATFGKLEHATITFTDGFQIVQAPNEWGKSTWCAFLTAMLYGIETRTKSTKNALADKEHYLPWSGSSMEGRIDLCANGRNLTIERSTKGRIPLGRFSAFETESGIPVPELTADNCGEMLLGVERSVFLRSAFIRLSDMPLTQDDALRRRLNALVTTGDESGDAERLATSLRELKNRCRYHRTGILPQVEAERDALDAKIRELETLENEANKLAERQVSIDMELSSLCNHQIHLAYAAAQAERARVLEAEQALRDSQSRLEAAREACTQLPGREETERILSEIRALSREGSELQMQVHTLPEIPSIPPTPPAFSGLNPQEACERTKSDSARYTTLRKNEKLLLILGFLFAFLGVVMSFFFLIPGISAMTIGIGICLIAARKKKEAENMVRRYGTDIPSEWISRAQGFAQEIACIERALQEANAIHVAHHARAESWRERVRRVTEGCGLDVARKKWEDISAQLDARDAAQRDAENAEKIFSDLSAIVRMPKVPETPDYLTETEMQTEQKIRQLREEAEHLRARLNQYEGCMEVLGDKEELFTARDRCNARIVKLEAVYSALTIAQQTLIEASLSLQRRFAPQITKRAQELMAKFTDGRYERLSLGEDLGLRSSALGEDTMRSAIWRSDGTTDQLYLALRLAVSEALTPDAPLILDDALVRFDDVRLKAVLEVLSAQMPNRQIILFTCQSREKRLMAQTGLLQEELP